MDKESNIFQMAIILREYLRKGGPMALEHTNGKME
jgi:hypothetical protein